MLKRRLGSLILSAVILASSVLLAHAEEGTVQATSAWIGKGSFFQVKDKLSLFAGAFEGIMFVENQEGSLNAAKIVCPGLVEINLDDGKQSGEGRCVIMNDKGEHIYARWQCAGTHLEGCTGPFSLLGGTGRFKEITGRGDFHIRSDIAEYVLKAGSDRVEGTATGVAVWPALNYKFP